MLAETFQPWFSYQSVSDEVCSVGYCQDPNDMQQQNGGMMRGGPRGGMRGRGGGRGMPRGGPMMGRGGGSPMMGGGSSFSGGRPPMR